MHASNLNFVKTNKLILYFIPYIQKLKLYLIMENAYSYHLLICHKNDIFVYLNEMNLEAKITHFVHSDSHNPYH
jgi:hypothetical protein